MQNLEMKTNSREKFEEAVHTTILPLVVSLGFGDYWKRSQELLEMDRLPVEMQMSSFLYMFPTSCRRIHVADQ